MYYFFYITSQGNIVCEYDLNVDLKIKTICHVKDGNTVFTQLKLHNVTSLILFQKCKLLL